MPQPATRNPQPTTQNNQQPTTNNQQHATSNKQQPTSNNQQPTSKKQQPTTQPPTHNPQPQPHPTPTALPHTTTTTTRLHQVHALSPAVDLQGGRWRCGLCRQAEAGATAADALASRAAVAPMALVTASHHSFDRVHAEHAAPRSQRTGTGAGECEVLKSREAPKGRTLLSRGSGQHRFWCAAGGTT